EDGIRDLIVTGVQTCALPISVPRLLALPRGDRLPRRRRVVHLDGGAAPKAPRGRREGHLASACGREAHGELASQHGRLEYQPQEIGRASCRERASVSEDEVFV